MLSEIKSWAILFAGLCICTAVLVTPSYAVQNPHSNTFAFHDGDAVCFHSKNSLKCGTVTDDYDSGLALFPRGICKGVFSGIVPNLTNSNGANATRAQVLDITGGSTGVVSSLTFHLPGRSGQPQTGNFCLYQDGVGGYWSIEPTALSKGTDNGIASCSPANTFSPSTGCTVTKKQLSSSPVEGTQQAINDFMQNRANHIYNNQPNMTNFFTGNNTTGGGPLGALAFNGSTSDLSLAFSTSRSRIQARVGQSIQASSTQKRIDQAFGTSVQTSSDNSQILSFADNIPAANQAGILSDKLAAVSAYGSSQGSASEDRTGNWDVWTQVYGARSKAGDSKSTLWVGYAGGHVFVSPNMMVGVMGQLDWADESNSTSNSDADGFGWMIGPYIAGRMPDKNVFYEARLSWGQSDNKISPIGTYTDSFETERWMAYGKISGAYEVGKVTIKPEASLGWFEEKQKAYTDSLANVIPSQTVSLGEVRIGPSIEWKHLLEDGTLIRPSLGISGVMNFGIAENTASQGAVLGNKDIRARFDAGIRTTNTKGWTFSASGYHDGIGINDYHSYGGTMKLIVPLN